MPIYSFSSWGSGILFHWFQDFNSFDRTKTRPPRLDTWNTSKSIIQKNWTCFNLRWQLASDWSDLIMWPEYWTLIGQILTIESRSCLNWFSLFWIINFDVLPPMRLDWDHLDSEWVSGDCFNNHSNHLHTPTKLAGAYSSQWRWFYSIPIYLLPTPTPTWFYKSNCGLLKKQVWKDVG